MEECSVIITENGLTVEYGTIRIQGLEDIKIKKSPTDIGESLKSYIASKAEVKETIEENNSAEESNTNIEDTEIK
ncbi:hypothetical protein [Clostridium beijerinckii]|uniref:Uncharacterized protein n=1 Tax=Clostridium beijerinckii TaxID=1520 RepID=A0AAX0B0P3_CLOBE|nr:hypothetical protein [Clostridium beijerinckii]NRT88890.1 hypothetical protein [Clostridium beijerinckii]NYC74345.1 hypothetical protein [Clostridium beijerinckii]